MGVNKANKERAKVTTKQEKAYEKTVTLEYQDVYRRAKEEIAKFIALYGSSDGKFTAEAYKYDRYDKLIQEITANVSNLKAVQPRSVNSYLKDQYLANYYYTGFSLETQFQSKLGFKPLKRQSLDPLSITGNVSLKQNADIVRSNLAKAITSSIASGDGIGNTAQRVKVALERNANDALRISRTETTTALNEANLRGMNKASETLKIQKEWVATLDNRTRDRHRRMDGERRDLDKKFSNGLMYPGDQSAGKPEEVINCRCYMIEVIEGYDNARDYRRARGVDGKNEVIHYKTYEEWSSNRL